MVRQLFADTAPIHTLTLLGGYERTLAAVACMPWYGQGCEMESPAPRPPRSSCAWRPGCTVAGAPLLTAASPDAPLPRKLHPRDGPVLIRIARQQRVVAPPPALRIRHQAFLVLDAVGQLQPRPDDGAVGVAQELALGLRHPLDAHAADAVVELE